MTDYQSEYRHSLDDPATFWAEQASKIAWFRKPETILGRDQNDNDAWFVDGELNSSYLALDYHIESGRGDQTALIYDSPVTGSQQKFTFAELRDEVARFAGVLVLAITLAIAAYVATGPQRPDSDSSSSSG